MENTSLKQGQELLSPIPEYRIENNAAEWQESRLHQKGNLLTVKAVL